MKDAAERIGCGEANVRKLLDSGKLKGDKVGGRWLVWSNSVNQYAGKESDDADECETME